MLAKIPEWKLNKWVMFYGVYKKNLSNLWERVYSPEKSGGKGDLLYT
jgi:hypothetical protein